MIESVEMSPIEARMVLIRNGFQERRKGKIDPPSDGREVTEEMKTAASIIEKAWGYENCL